MSRVFCPILYYLPGIAKKDHIPETIDRLHDASRGPLKMRLCNPGPDGGKGLLVSIHAGECVRYEPSIQRWDRRNGFWIGCEKDVQPSQLLRESIPGEPVVLADGNEWVIPIANPMFETCTLDQWMKIDENGAWVREVADEFQELSRLALEIAEHIGGSLRDGEMRFPYSDQETWDILARIIAVNYDLDLDEISILRLLNDASLWQIAYTFCDVGSLRNMFALGVESDAENPIDVPPDSNGTSSGGTD